MTEHQENVFYGEGAETDAYSIKCSACGANMKFDPDSQTLYCEHCDSRQKFGEGTTAEEQDIRFAMSSGNVWDREETSVFRCENCGAEVVLNKNETAKTCPFCGTSHVQKAEELSGLKPNAVLPFLFGAKQAIDYAKAWAKRKFYAPRKFKKSLSADKVNGVYMPCFTFDSCTSSVYHARLGERHTRVVGSGKNRRVETYTVYFNVSGTYSWQFDDVLISAGSKINQKNVDALSPYDTNLSKTYEEEYLLGFMAYHYDKDLQSCWDSAKNVMDASLKRQILSGYRYDVVDYFNISTTHQNVTYKYVMLPVYVSNFKYNKKLYNFYVNGTTGKVAGKTPVSPWKVLLTVLGVCAVIGGIALIVYLSGG